jgi:chromate transporter
MAIHIGHRQGGWPGLLIAGACFIIPAMLIVLACAWFYVRYGNLPEAAGILYGIKPVIIAVVLQALWTLGKAALKTKFLIALAILVTALNFVGVNEIALLFGTASLIALWKLIHRASARLHSRSLPLLALLPLPQSSLLLVAAQSPVAAATASTPFALWPLFLFFAKVGSVLYGSGYVLLAFLRSGLVERFGWLTEAQLLDAVAVGQFTPGPVFTTATFIGYILGGTPAALAATAGIFLPAFIFVAISGPLIPRIRKSPTAAAILDAVNAASLALMAVVTFQLAQAAVIDWLTLALAILSAILLVRYKINSAWLVLAGALVGLATSL